VCSEKRDRELFRKKLSVNRSIPVIAGILASNLSDIMPDIGDIMPCNIPTGRNTKPD